VIPSVRGDGPEKLPEDIEALQAALLATRAELASVRAHSLTTRR
jgi:hypothetical protein